MSCAKRVGSPAREKAASEKHSKKCPRASRNTRGSIKISPFRGKGVVFKRFVSVGKKVGRWTGRGTVKNFNFFLKIVLDTFQSLCYIPSQLKALRKRRAEFEKKFPGRPEGRYQRME